jgi:hypothetical protein
MPLSSSRRALAAAALAAVLGLAQAVPQVQTLTCSPGIVDARSTDVLVTCALRVLDRDADIDFAYTRLISPSGKFSLPLFFDGRKSIGIASFTGYARKRVCVWLCVCGCVDRSANQRVNRLIDRARRGVCDPDCSRAFRPPTPLLNSPPTAPTSPRR